jgi:hypothetical protein
MYAILGRLSNALDMPSMGVSLGLDMALILHPMILMFVTSIFFTQYSAVFT